MDAAYSKQRLRVWELTAQGLSSREIADQLVKEGYPRITPQAVNKLVRKHGKMLFKQFAGKINNQKVAHSARLDLIYKWLIADYQFTCREKFFDEKGRLQTRRTAGNEKYLKVAKEVLADIRKIWGTDEATKIEVSGETQLAIDVDSFVQAKKQAEIEYQQWLVEQYGPQKEAFLI